MLEQFIRWLNQYKSAIKIEVLDDDHTEISCLHYDFAKKVFVDEEGRGVLLHSELDDNLKADGLSIETVWYDEGKALDLNGLVGNFIKLWSRHLLTNKSSSNMSVVISKSSPLIGLVEEKGLVYDEDKGGFGFAGEDRELIDVESDKYKKLQQICDDLNGGIVEHYDRFQNEKRAYRYHDKSLHKSKITLFKFRVETQDILDRFAEVETWLSKPYNRIIYVQCAYDYPEYFKFQ